MHKAQDIYWHQLKTNITLEIMRRRSNKLMISYDVVMTV